MGIRNRLGHLTRKARDEDHGAVTDKNAGSAAHEAVRVAQYKYVLRVASPHLLEQVHREAFETLPAEQIEPVYLKMSHDLPEGQRPRNSSAEEMARAAGAAQRNDQGYMLRALRRPGQGVSEGHDVSASANPVSASLYAGSVLGPFAAAVVGSTAASEVLSGFQHSPEAAQVDPTLFARSPHAVRDARNQIVTGGYDMGRE